MFLAMKDLRRGSRRFALLGLVVALIALLSTVLSGLATGLVSDGISGLRALPFDRLVFQDGADATFSRSNLDSEVLERYRALEGVEATPIGASFVNAAPVDGGPSLDIAMFGISADSFLLDRPEARASMSTKPGLVLTSELEDEGVEVGDRYTVSGADFELPVLGFTFAGTYGHAPIAFVSLDTWQHIQFGDGTHERFSAIALSGDNPDFENVAAETDTEVLTKQGAYAGSPGYTAETTTMTLIRGFLLVISALVIGAFFTVLTVQRTRQIGLLKAMGASNAYILRDGIGQMTILVSLATVVGVAAGVGVITFLSQGGSAPVELDVGSLVTVTLLLIGSGIVGSLAAFRRVTLVEPAIALGVES